MHVLFVHPNYPAQFGHVAEHLVSRHGHRCTFVSEKPPMQTGGFERIQYRLRGGATAQNHYCARTFENPVWHTHAVYEALKARPDVRPDLVIGHSGFGSTLFLRELYGCPLVNYFEYFYRATGSDLDYRPDFPACELSRLCAYARNAMLLLDLENCDCYGGDERVTAGRSFEEWVLAQDDYDPSRFVFLGLLPPPELAQLFALSNLHVYLTVPFVLSWSLLNALACGATVLASGTAPVSEVIEHGRTGLLCDFFDVDGMTETADRVLDEPSAFRDLGRAGVELIRGRYSLESACRRCSGSTTTPWNAHPCRVRSRGSRLTRNWLCAAVGSFLRPVNLRVTHAGLIRAGTGRSGCPSCPSATRSSERQFGGNAALLSCLRRPTERQAGTSVSV